MAKQLSEMIRILALDSGQYAETCKLEWKPYKEDHPGTDKSQGQYVQECVERKENQQTKREKSREEKPDAGGRGGDGADKNVPVDEMGPTDKANHEKEMEKKLDVSPEDAKALSDAGFDTDINKKDLAAAIDNILGEKKPEGTPWHERLVQVAEFLVDIVDIDEYILGLPNKAKSLAEYMFKTIGENKKRQKDTVEGLLDHGINYDDYVKQADKGNPLSPPMNKEEWDKLKGEIEKAEKTEDTKKRLKDQKEPGSSNETENKDKTKAKGKKPEKEDTKPKPKKEEDKLQPRKNTTQDVIDKLKMEDKQVDYLQGQERNRSINDAEFMRRALSGASPEFRRRMKGMDPKEFRELFDALWAEKQP